MTEGQTQSGPNIGAQELTEGGQQAALGIAPHVMSNELITNGGTQKVFEMNTFRKFVEQQADLCLGGWVPRSDALSAISDVVRVRKLHEILDDQRIRQVIRSCFLDVVDGENPENGIEHVSFPGVIRADFLQVIEFEPATLVVPPFIAEGVTLFAGKPKLGKSWLMLDIALGIASGLPVLGNMPVTQGQVLGLFLEDNERRLQSRITRLAPAGDVWPADLSLATQWPRIDEGGLSDLEAWCQETKNPKCIIIDTLAKLRPRQVSRKSQYDLDYDSLSGLHRIGHKFRVAILVVHHARKADADDVFDTVSGTL